MGKKTTTKVFEMATGNICPAQLTYQSGTIAYLFNSCMYLVLIKFGLGVNIGLKSTLNEFEMTMAIFFFTGPANH